MIPHYTDIQYFNVIAETLNLSRASERLGVVQPTLSQSLRRLEDAAGTSLFIRKKNGMELTPAGHVFREKSQEFLQNWTKIVKEVHGILNLPQGRFKIGVHVSVGLYFLGHFLPQLLKDHPLIEVDLVHGLSREILEELVTGKVDFGLVINPRPHPDLVLKSLLKDRVGIWTSKGKYDPDQVIADFGLNQSESVLKRFNKLFSRKVSSSSLEIIADLTQKGVGVGVLPERVARLYDLQALPESPWFSDELFLCYHSERQKSQAAKIIIDAIKNTKGV